jgi:hypothetical protein
MQAVKVEGVQIKVEPSTTLRPRNASFSNPPNASYLSGARKGSDRVSAAPSEKRGLEPDSESKPKRRRKIEEANVKIEISSDVEPKVEAKGVSLTPSSPFPDFLRPTAEECRVSTCRPNHEEHVQLEVWQGHLSVDCYYRQRVMP